MPLEALDIQDARLTTGLFGWHPIQVMRPSLLLMFALGCGCGGPPFTIAAATSDPQPDGSTRDAGPPGVGDVGAGAMFDSNTMPSVGTDAADPPRELDAQIDGPADAPDDCTQMPFNGRCYGTCIGACPAPTWNGSCDTGCGTDFQGQCGGNCAGYCQQNGVVKSVNGVPCAGTCVGACDANAVGSCTGGFACAGHFEGSCGGQCMGACVSMCE